MFQVTNTLTFQTWTTDSRDELLAELDVINARRNPLDPSEVYEVIMTDEDGQILATTQVSFPLDRIIDEVLLDFGHPDNQDKPGVFNRLFSRFKRQPKEAVTIDEQREELELVEEDDQKDTGADQAPDPQPEPETDQDPLAQLLIATRLGSEEEEVFSSDDRNQADPLPQDQEQPRHQPQPLRVPTEPAVLVEKEPAGQGLATSPYPELTSGLESLSTHALQLEFAGRIKAQISQIDQTIIALQQQLKELEHQKQGHLSLLEAINAHHLN